jgi:dipeptidyl aminopeptidase/acylaminoacyl peptidase
MKTVNSLLPLLLVSILVQGQDGKILSKQPISLHDTIYARADKISSSFGLELKKINFYRISYLSDGLKVTGFLAEPKGNGKYPCIISNRGGNREFGRWDTLRMALSLGQMATWGYVVIASQYRGNDGGEGKEEFGGKDLNDVLNLIPALSQLPTADTARIGIEGTSRGGMMTYLALKNTCRFKAAVVRAGTANAFTTIASRPEMEKYVFAELVPDYPANKERELKARSAVFWADVMCKTTPLLIMHGSADWRVPPAEALELVQKLVASKHPTRFILFEGADHGIFEYRTERLAETKRHFDYYLHDGKKWPSMEPHGD